MMGWLMRILSIRKWVDGDLVETARAGLALRGSALPAAEPAPAGPGSPAREVAHAAAARKPRWPLARIAAVESLWGPGFIGPGGGREVLRLVSPMGLNANLTLLLVGGGLGGPAAAIANKSGAWVESFEADTELAAFAEQRRQADRELKRVSIAGWDRDAPAFKPKSASHALAMEAMRGAPAGPIVESLAQALRPHGHIVLTELVTDGPAPGADREFAAWCRLEDRRPDLPRPQAILEALLRRRFDVRIMEDLSERHIAATLSGWRAAVQAMEEGPKPEPMAAGMFVTEAELWLLRLRLMRKFGIRLMRWHAIGQ